MSTQLSDAKKQRERAFQTLYRELFHWLLPEVIDFAIHLQLFGTLKWRAVSSCVETLICEVSFSLSFVVFSLLKFFGCRLHVWCGLGICFAFCCLFMGAIMLRHPQSSLAKL